MAAHDRMIVAAVLVAAGDGVRLGADVPKALVEIAGRTLLEHAVDRFMTHPAVRDVVVAAPATALDRAGSLLPGATVVAGGADRQSSVSCGLAAVADDVELVLVHDVARAFVPAEVITRVVDALSGGADAVVPAVPVSDTIRSVDAETGDLGGIVDRAQLTAMQTPQGFRRDVLVRAHAAGAGRRATDDAALVEALGVRVRAVAGDERAFKITHPLDLALAEVVARG
jgi:2-C-methyl-D-erythritol 4-phosphate cytidylyltransferase